MNAAAVTVTWGRMSPGRLRFAASPLADTAGVVCIPSTIATVTNCATVRIIVAFLLLLASWLPWS